MKFKDFVTNKNVLYVVLFLAIVSVLGYLMQNDQESVVFFLAVSLLMSFFTKNMVIVLGTAIIITNMIKASKSNARSSREGFKRNKMHKKNKMMEKKESKVKAEDAAAMNALLGGEVKQGMKNKEKYQNKNELKPKEVQIEDDDEQEFIDHSATMEKAYDNMERILGGEGMQKLTKDTQGLIQQQRHLAKNLESMTPMMKEARGLLDGFDFDKMTNLVSSLGGMKKKE